MKPNTSGQDLSQNRQSSLRSTNIVLIVLASFFVGLRFLSRWKKRAYIGIDDFFIILAYIFLLALFSSGMLMIHYGLGVHAAALDANQLINVGKCLVAFECLFVITVTLTKLSLLFMYCRIFPVDSMRIGCWILGILSVCWCISLTVVCFLQCIPLAKAWNPTVPGRCINLKATFIGNAVPNTLTDVAILTLPMAHVWRLRTTLIQKCQLSFLFLLGSFVVFTSIYRFTKLFQFVPSDLTWTLAQSCTWVILESSAGIISACLPTLAPLLHFANIMHWRRNKPLPTISPFRSANVITTIGGSGGMKRNQHSRFERLDESVLRDEDFMPVSNAELAINMYHSNDRTEGGEGGQDNGDEIPLKGIQTRVKVEGSKERDKLGEA